MLWGKGVVTLKLTTKRGQSSWGDCFFSACSAASERRSAVLPALTRAAQLKSADPGHYSQAAWLDGDC